MMLVSPASLRTEDKVEDVGYLRRVKRFLLLRIDANIIKAQFQKSPCLPMNLPVLPLPTVCPYEHWCGYYIKPLHLASLTWELIPL